MIPKSKILTPSYQNPKTEEGKKKRKKKRGFNCQRTNREALGTDPLIR